MNRINEIEARLQAATRTLEHLGYTYHGGELWKPPVGKPPNFDLLSAKDAEIERLKSEVSKYRTKYAECWKSAL